MFFPFRIRSVLFSALMLVVICVQAQNEQTQDSLWEGVSLASTKAKVISVPPPAVDRYFPWIPVAIGVGAVGGAYLIYELVKDDDKSEDDAPASCDFEFSATIDQAYCNPGSGSIQIQIENPSLYSFEWLSGQSGAFIENLSPGDYSCTITYLNLGCDQTAVYTINAQSETPILVDDFYDTPINNPLTVNVFENDSGSNLILQDVADPAEGVVSFLPNGDVIFTPNLDVTAQVSMNYTAANDCGLTESALLVINIQGNQCDISVTTTIVNADCGIANGQLDLALDPPGQYTYQWSSGETSANLTDVYSGSYLLTITDVDCTYDTLLVVPENPTDYLQNLTVESGMCGANGFVGFDLSSPDGGQMVLSLTHPNGQDFYTVPSGFVDLGSILPLISGDYSMEVYPELAGPACAEVYTWSLSNLDAPDVAVVEIMGTTSEDSEDGSAQLEILNFTGGPYEVFLDGALVGSFSDANINLTGLTAGPHTVGIIDVMGCVQTITLEVPVGNGFNMELFYAPNLGVGEREKSTQRSNHYNTQLNFGYQYPIFGLPFESRVGVPLSHFDFENISLAQHFVQGLYSSSILDSDLKIGGVFNPMYSDNLVEFNIRMEAALKLTPILKIGGRIESNPLLAPAEISYGFLLQCRLNGIANN